MQQLVLVSQKAEAVAVMLRASHIPRYSLSVREPEELSGLILSLESTCQDLFATGYFESDISDDPLTPRLTEKCFCNSFPLQRRESTDTRRICRNGEIGKLEKALRPVFDLSCFSFLAGGSYEMSIWPINKAFVILLLNIFFHDGPPKAITVEKTGLNPPTCIDSIHFAWCCPPFFFFHLWWYVPACQSGYVWISLECICRGSN